MGIKLERKTEAGKLLKLISVHDDAIDWKATYPDESSIPRKKKRYEDERNIQDLRFLEGSQPDLFVFDHPQRSDVSKKIRGLYSRTLTGEQTVDLFSECFNKAFIGVEHGLDGGPMDDAPRRNGIITEAYFQALEDSGVFEELALAFVNASKKQQDQSEIHKKK